MITCFCPILPPHWFKVKYGVRDLNPSQYLERGRNRSGFAARSDTPLSPYMEHHRIEPLSGTSGVSYFTVLLYGSRYWGSPMNKLLLRFKPANFDNTIVNVNKQINKKSQVNHAHPAYPGRLLPGVQAIHIFLVQGIFVASLIPITSIVHVLLERYSIMCTWKLKVTFFSDNLFKKNWSQSETINIILLV